MAFDPTNTYPLIRARQRVESLRQQVARSRNSPNFSALVNAHGEAVKDLREIEHAMNMTFVDDPTMPGGGPMGGSDMPGGSIGG